MASTKTRIARQSDAIDVINGLNKIRHESLGVLCGREVAQTLHDLYRSLSVMITVCDLLRRDHAASFYHSLIQAPLILAAVANDISGRQDWASQPKWEWRGSSLLTQSYSPVNIATGIFVVSMLSSLPR